jgi:hypothetical protein
MTNKSAKNDNPTPLSNIDELDENEIDQSKFSWIHKHTDFEVLDKLHFFEIYFPDFNLVEVL